MALANPPILPLVGILYFLQSDFERKICWYIISALILVPMNLHSTVNNLSMVCFQSTSINMSYILNFSAKI
jgi:hypothetical protein